MNKYFDFDKFVDDITSQVEESLVKRILHPEVPEEWTVAAFGLGHSFYRVAFDNYDMADISDGAVVRAICAVVDHFAHTEYHFSEVILDGLLDYCNKLLDNFADQFYANGDKTFMYRLFAEAYKAAEADEKAEKMANEGDKWEAWDEEYHDFEFTDFHCAFVEAEKGDADEQMYVATCYDVGSEVEQNERLANIWYSVSALNGNKEARAICEKRDIDWHTIWW